MTARATLRLQFHKGFSFADAERHIPYFARLGISHIYASPITTARPGSLHGYDVIDPTRVNPELGGEGALRQFVSALRHASLGLVIDIVPNHMAVGEGNAWWFDVLRHGRESRYAAYFDIDWEAEDERLRGKVLLPVLGTPLQRALRDGEIDLACGDDGFELRYDQQRFPVAGDVREGEPVSAILSRQHYRLAWWRVANDEINWRRFFDINELAALRMEHEPAFEDTHALIFRLYAEGLIDGVRVDHIDGLSDPAGYCGALRARLDALNGRRPADAPRGRAYIVVEKILLRGETLPTIWMCDGTSGYDFMNDVSAVQHDSAGEPILGHLWHAVSGRSANFEPEEEAARREIVARSFSAQIEACVATFHRVANAESAEISRAALRRALTELLAHFPAYRTYGTSSESLANDDVFRFAIGAAKARCLSIDRDVIDHLQIWFTERSSDPVIAALQDRAVTQFQQLSAPVAAKAVEDTAFYRYGRLLSRNDVGFDVARFSDSATDFHGKVTRRAASFPHAMLATATHDHKRGEDVRARLAILGEYAQDWANVVRSWMEQCEPIRRAVDGALLPHASDIAILFQMIVGAWPLGLNSNDGDGRRAFAERLARWQEKALREAKLATDWSLPNESYEAAARELLMALIARNERPDLLHEIVAFVEKIAAAGAVNGLAQTLLKLTVPGVPDIYQGTDFWDFSLVDPDNRRPVDFAARAASLDSGTLATLANSWRDGRIKQALIATTLALRRTRPRLFTEGLYDPIEVHGAHAHRVVAFARRCHDDVAVAIVPRIASSLLSVGRITFPPHAWNGTNVMLPSNRRWTDVFSGHSFDRPRVEIAELLQQLPVALLVSA